MAPVTALVLSGGCLRGLAQIGVLKALAAAGVRPDLVVGASVGAVIGALFAAGRTPEEIERLAKAVVIARLKRWTLSRRGLWSTSGLRELLREHLPYVSIEQFPLRFAAVATDVATGQATVIDSGDASDAIVASAAMPGFFVPATVDGRFYTDGCLVSPLPVRAARALGAQRVIAVNTLCNPGHSRGRGLLDLVMRSPRMMMCALAAHEASGADLVITPPLSTLDASVATRRQALIDSGEREALRALASFSLNLAA
jgi:NTE family protein